MIKLFQKIRQRLLRQKKFSEYFTYALGEIILVVIGILLALQINTWNNKRIDRQKEYTILTDLQEELSDQLDQLDIHIQEEHGYTENGRDVLQYYAKHQIFYGSDSIYSKINALVSRKTFNPTNSTFQELITTGNIGLIRDKKVKRKVIQYYQELERNSLIISNNNIQIVDDIYQSTVLKYTVFTTEKGAPFIRAMNNEIFDGESLEGIKAASQLSLSSPEVALHTFNVLEQRTLIAMLNEDRYKALQKVTQDLLSELKNHTNKEIE